MDADEQQRMVDQVAQEVINRIALGNKVNKLAEQAIQRMVLRATGAIPATALSPNTAQADNLMASSGVDVRSPTVARQPRKLILKSKLSPGDILMLTAAVRDLHLTYPGMFVTDVRTPCSLLWESNPYITPLLSHDPDVKTIDCHYPLVHKSNQVPYHFIHAYRLFLNRELGLQIQPHAFKGDIHLRPEEKAWVPQVQEITGSAKRYWIIASGGKKDFTNKIWAPERFQAVVDHFRDQLTFVQVGQEHHIHPPLDGVINLVGKTDLRQLVRLMYHADGVVCGVSLPMHLAAAVETKAGSPRNRPCVVVAGGREPSQWEAYPHHQYLHRNGSLPCCDAGGCWTSRVVPLGDGMEYDNNLCVYPIVTPSGNALPKCLDMITPDDVIRAIQSFLSFDSVPVQLALNARSRQAEQGRDGTHKFGRRIKTRQLNPNVGVVQTQ